MWVMSLPSSPRFSGAFGKRRKPDVVWDFGSLISKSESFKHHQKCFPSCQCCYCAEAEGHDETEGITKGSFWCLASGWIANAITWSLTSLILCLQHIQSLVRALHVAHLVNKHKFYSFTPLYFSHTAVNLDCELRIGGNFSEKAPTLSPAGKFCIYKKRPWGFSPDYTPPFFFPVLWTQNSSYYLCLTEGLSDSSITRLFYY